MARLIDSWRARAPRLRRGMGQAGSAAFAFGARSLQQITTFVLTLLAARFLTPAEYGVYTLSVLFVTFIQTLIYTGFFHYVVRAKGEERAIVDTCFWLILGLSTAGSAILAAASPALAQLFDAPDLATVLLLLAAMQPVAAVTAWCSSVLMRQGRMRLHFRALVAQNLLSLVAGVALMLAWQSVFALVAYRAVRALAGAAIYLGLSRVRPGLAFGLAIARDAARFSYALYGTRILNFLSNYGADLALGVAFGTAEAGLYRFGNRIATGAIDIVAQPIRSFALAQFGAAHRGDRPFGPVLERFASTMLVLIGCVAGTIVVFGEDVVRLFFQPSYAGALVVAYALAARSLLGIGSGFVEPILAAKGRTGAVLRHHALWTAVATASIPLAAGFGLGALAWSRAAVALASSAAGLRLIARLGEIDVRPALVASARAAAFVVAYTLLALWLRSTVGTGVEFDRSGLAAGLAASAAAGLATLVLAIRWRVLRLSVFSG